MRRYTIGKRAELPQPRKLLFSKFLDGFPPIGATEHPTDHHKHDIQQLVPFVAIDPRILKRRKMFFLSCFFVPFVDKKFVDKGTGLFVWIRVFRFA